MKTVSLLAAGMFTLAVGLLGACTEAPSCSNLDTGARPCSTSSPSEICTTYSGLVTCYTGLTECLEEGKPLASECNGKLELPWCLTEDDGIDGAYGPACFWRDPSTGDLWYNDGDGMD